MVSGKYSKDYGLENVLDANGKIKTVPVYRGPYFRFLTDGEALRKTKFRCVLLSVLSLAAAGIPLFVNTPLVHRWSVVLPFVCGLLPVAHLLMLTFRLLTAKEKLKREERDRISGRPAPLGIALFLCSLLSLVGQLLYYIRGSALWTDLLVTGCTLALAGIAAVLFSLKKNLQMEQVPSE